MSDQTQALLPVTQADRDAAADAQLARGLGRGEAIRLREGDADDHWLVQAFARHRISHCLPGGAPVTLSEGFEAEQDGDTFTIRFPDGHAITARADGRLAITKAFSGYFPFEVNVAALTPSPCPGDVGMREALTNAKYALEYWERESKVWSDNRVPGARPGWMTETRRRGREEIARIARTLAALTPSALSGDGMREALADIEQRCPKFPDKDDGPDDIAVEVELTWGDLHRIRSALTPSALSPEPVQKVHELPSALSGDAGEVEAIRQQIINTPETADFMAGVPIEAAHQRERWGASHDAGKSPFDWFWLVGYLAQKAASSAVAGDTQKAMHHTISTAAALANWHAALSGVATEMRPGIGPGNGGEKPGSAYALAAALPSHPGDAGEGGP